MPGLPLQNIVHDADRRLKIFVEFAEDAPHAFGHGISVTLCNGFKHPEVKLVVHMIHGPVPGLHRIGNT